MNKARETFAWIEEKFRPFLVLIFTFIFYIIIGRRIAKALSYKQTNKDKRSIEEDLEVVEVFVSWLPYIIGFALTLTIGLSLFSLVL